MAGAFDVQSETARMLMIKLASQDVFSVSIPGFGEHYARHLSDRVGHPEILHEGLNDMGG